MEPEKYLQNVVTFDKVKQTESLVLTRLICSVISLASCVAIIIIYGILWLQSKCYKVKTKKRISNGNSSNNQSFQRSLSSSSEKKTKESKKLSSQKGFGLGSHAMFFLVFSNLLWCIIAIISCTFYPKGFLFILDNYNTLCPLFGFFHNYFDLCSIGWTTIISFLFLSSTKSKAYTQGEERKTFILGIIISFGVPLFITLGPFYSSSYGPSGAYCSFDKVNPTTMTQVWSIAVQIYPVICIIYCCYAIIRVTCFYSGKLKLVKEHNKQEYSVLKWYVFIFILFPVFLSLSRLIKLINWSVEKILGKEDYIVILYFYSITYCLNGFFNSFLCLFFFRRVLKCGCCGSERKTGRTESENEMPINTSGTYEELLSKNGNDSD